MAYYIFRKLITAIVLVFCVATIVFLLLRMRPGGPATALIGDYGTQEAIDDLNRELGLDKPIWQQYGIYMYGLICGDLGVSYENQKPVMKLLRENTPFTLYIVVGSFIFGVPFGLAFGMFAAIKKGLPIDTAFRIFSLTWVSVPSFVVAIILILLFSVYLGWLPVASIQRLSDVRACLIAAVMPSLTLGLRMVGYLSRLTRTCFVDILVEDYIRTAESLGTPKHLILFKYGLRNALIAISTVMGIYVIAVIGVSPVIETVFARPGLGSLLVRAIQQSDFPVIQGTLVFFSLLVMIINLSIDILYGFIDPRVR